MAIQAARLRKQTGGFVLGLCVGAALCKFGRKRGYLAPDLVVRDAQIIGRLQIEQELRAGLKPVSETKSGVAGDGPLAPNDLRMRFCGAQISRDNYVKGTIRPIHARPRPFPPKIALVTAY